MTDQRAPIMNMEVGQDVEDGNDPHDQASLRSRSASLASTHSYTSTFGYNQEPWDEYRPRVESLCSTLWPASDSASARLVTVLRSNKLFRAILPSPQTTIIERLQGGDYNRITGITLSSSQKTEDFILRTNRWGEGRKDRESAILHYVRRHTTIPIPDVIMEDFSCNNALEKPYVVQKRIPGNDVDSIWESLSHSQRCAIACELGDVVSNLLALESPVPGLVDALPKDGYVPLYPRVLPFELKENDEIVDETKLGISSSMDLATRSQTAGELFKLQFTRWYSYSLTYPSLRDNALFESLLEAVREMDNMGLLNAAKHCLCHVDLHSGNIMADVQSDGSVKITGILDWDEAVIAPKFVNCQPPWWLWKEDGDERIDIEVDWPYELPAAPGFPHTPEKQELKLLFEEHAGPEWKDLAYGELSRLGRCLFVLAKEGLDTGEHYKAADRFLREWEELRQTLV